MKKATLGDQTSLFSSQHAQNLLRLRQKCAQ